MKFQSKFDLDQKVYHLRQGRRQSFVPCPSCSNGKVMLPDGRSLTCPRCNAKGAICENEVAYWRVSEPMRVGQIQIRVGGETERDEETYMTFETGVGSGNIYRGVDLFADSTLAQQECDKRNNEKGASWACVDCNIEFEQTKYSGWSDWRHCSVHGNRTLHVDIEKHQELLAKRKANESETQTES